tara:strand:+ start:485 stop:724 length:240 start_codon:yes stop_codon:yes gene_type:complete
MYILGIALVLIAFMSKVFNLLEDDSTLHLSLMASWSCIFALYSFDENQRVFFVLHVVLFSSAITALIMKQGHITGESDE